MRTSWDKFREAPFNLEAMDSGVLIVIGVVISIAALIDGYTLDDPYPGYSREDRKYRKKLSALQNEEDNPPLSFAQETEEMGSKVDEIIGEANDEAEKLIKKNQEVSTNALARQRLAALIRSIKNRLARYERLSIFILDESGTYSPSPGV